ncbi:hypothetical protein FRX31_006743 [Thalictrum thalictroides]|uniref:FBD domain-containing protein n=1 Tax=Thalictrum thalictroides TaxID=46969 RepID=A0A7J6X518_THATH|nr:hypothetical protein FRX31_006743 [Thalictrum thalictroides]
MPEDLPTAGYVLNNLRTAEIHGLSGSEIELELVKYILGYSCNLVKISISYSMQLREKKDEQTRIADKLSLFSRASPHAEIVFLEYQEKMVVSGPLTPGQVCGPEGKGRVRAAGTGISRTSMLMSAPAIEQVNVEKQKSMTIMEQVKAQGEQIAKLCKVVMELEQSVSQSSHRQPNESGSSHARPPAMGSTFSVRRNDCRLSCFGGGVVAHGQVQNTTSLDGNGELYNVLVAVVLDPTAQLFKHNVSMSTFGDVVVGITIIELPKVFTQFLS